MYRYEYEKINCDLSGWGPFAGNAYGIGNYKEIINERARNGWRYIGYMPTKQRGTGHVEEIELIFEKAE